MFIWTAEKIHWYQQAANYTKYYEEIFREIKPFIDKTDHVCDLGCGLGDLTIELATIANKVTGIDISAEALAVLQQKITENNISNIETIESSWTDLSLIPQWDVVVVSFFRQNFDDFIKLLKKARKRIIVVTTNGSESTFLPKQKEHRNRGKIKSLKKAFDEVDLQYKCIERTLQFGQPLSSVNDARAYIKEYVPEVDEAVMEAHIDERLQTITDGDFAGQYFFSNQKEIGIFIIEKSAAQQSFPQLIK